KIEILMTVKQKIIQLFVEQKELTVTEIANELLVSRQMVHRVLKELLADNVVEKMGRTPKTVYRKRTKRVGLSEVMEPIPEAQAQFLQDNFLMITEVGEMLHGARGFKNWCVKRKLPFEKTIREFINTKKKYNAY